MDFSPALRPATLVRRYKRFLADVITEQGEALTLHCPNTGAMTGCGSPGDKVWYSISGNPKRKYACTWELTETHSGDVICVNTQRANQLTEETLRDECIPALAGYENIKREVKYGHENSRCDFMLQACKQVNCYIEVKSVTLSDEGQGYFPDAVTTRGQKHLRELIAIAEQGERAVLLFAALHTAITCVSPASHIDAAYAQLLKQALHSGVEVYAWGASISPEKMVLNRPLNVVV